VLLGCIRTRSGERGQKRKRPQRGGEGRHWRIFGKIAKGDDDGPKTASMLTYLAAVLGWFWLWEKYPAPRRCNMIKLSETREITPYLWVHPDEDG
jgi:hypothetical protein